MRICNDLIIIKSCRVLPYLRATGFSMGVHNIPTDGEIMLKLLEVVIKAIYIDLQLFFQLFNYSSIIISKIK